MAKFPILEWKEIDGIDTPFTYPQHEKKDGSFVVTGENDPLPVAGYGMTDNGIWIPKRVNDDGSVNTQLTGSKSEYEVVLARGVRTESVIIQKDVPKTAIGCFLEHIVYGVSGVFEENEGHAIMLMPYNSSAGRPLSGTAGLYETPPSTGRTLLNSSYSLSLSNVCAKNIDEYNIINFIEPYYSMIRIDLRVYGTFEIGQGVDSELRLHFLYR